jgi:phosphomannomutase
MPLIKSISGIRGTIGGQPGDNLTPLDVLKFSAAYGKWLKNKCNGKKVVIGRDARISGSIINQLVINTLLSMGIEVVDAGLSTTPTVEMAVIWEKADGGIIITASHNPKQWNALKLLNSKGEFISAEDGKYILQEAASDDFNFETVDGLGRYSTNDHFIQQHIDAVLQLGLINVPAIKKRNFKVVIDVVNSTGAIALPPLMKALGVEEVIIINGEMTGDFSHNPEPLPEHLIQLSQAVIDHKADMGIAVDPDVDRLCFVNEDGTMFGEEYTLVAVADYMLSVQNGNAVSNLSSTRALRDIAIKHHGQYFASAVGEVNVVEKMKAVKAVIGGEGNGGIIVPDLHYGRDALAGIALFLSALAAAGTSISSYRKTFPDYFMAKKKIDLQQGTDVKALLMKIKDLYQQYPVNMEDGLKIELETGWIHLRSSNTEPIIRIYTENTSQQSADDLATKVMKEIAQYY